MSNYVSVSNLLNHPVVIRANLITGVSRTIKFAPNETKHVDKDVILGDMDTWEDYRLRNVLYYDPSQVGFGGSTGPQGATGPLGGPQGATGLQGATGIGGGGGGGAQGVTGLRGMTGVGVTGLQGVTGPGGGGGGGGGATGLQGVTGLRGMTGVAGIGTQGVTGLSGTAGTQGVTGVTGAGTQGATGLSGTAGSQGVTGVGVTGPSGGPQGVTGPSGGLQGVTGLQGPMGLTGVGLQGITGLRGVTGVGVTGPSGGPQGATGLVGPIGPAGGQVTQYVSFDSGNVRVFASGMPADIAAITATKDFSVASTSRLILGVTGTAVIHSINVTFTSLETTGRTQINVEMPEPNGSTNMSTSVRPIAFRINNTYGVGAVGGTIANSSGTLIMTLTGYTSATEQKAVALI